MNENMNMSGEHGACTERTSCRCPHHSVKAVGITLVGIFFLLGALGQVSDQTVGIVLGIVLIVVGVSKLFGKFCKCC